MTREGGPGVRSQESGVRSQESGVRCDLLQQDLEGPLPLCREDPSVVSCLFSIDALDDEESEQLGCGGVDTNI